MKRSRMFVALAGTLALTLSLTACGSDGGGGEEEAEPAAAPAAGENSLKGVCPDPLIIQTDWNPEAEYGGTYELVGPDPEIDTEAKKVTGPLVAGGKDTGVDVEIRIGGAAVGFQPVQALMYQDKSITLGYDVTDSSIRTSADQPTLGVMARMEIDPQMIMWDPESHPEFNTIADIGQTDITVIYSEGATYMDYLIGSGLLKKSQVDASYDGSPARFVSSGGNVAQQGFATDEPFTYENELPQWGKPVDFELIHDTGYPIYRTYAIRAGELEELRPCLEKLVPILQQARVDYSLNPESTNELIVKLVEEYNTGWQYSPERAAYSAEKQLELGIVSNGPDDTYGNFDMERVQKVIDIVSPIATGQNVEIKENLKPEDIATNEFIDKSIGLPSS